MEKINEVEAEGDKPIDQSALLVERIVQVEPPIIDPPKAEERPANETDPRPASESPKVKTRPAKRKTNTEKVRCDKCLREFNPAYLSRHICKPCVVSNEPGGKPGEEPTEPRPASETPPIPHPIVREATAVIPEDPPQRELTAADVAAFLRKQKVAQRAEKMAKYSAAMFGA